MQKKVVITVVGKDTVGIIARVCTVLSGHGINILDISQTIVSGFFNMMMIVDTSGSELTMAELTAGLNEVGIAAGVTIHAQHEDIFNMMHRI